MVRSALSKIVQMVHSDLLEFKLSYPRYSVKPECTIRFV